MQELKGNIRVFCRVRPLVGSDALTPSTAVDQLLQFPSSGVPLKPQMGFDPASNAIVGLRCTQLLVCMMLQGASHRCLQLPKCYAFYAQACESQS